MPSPVIELRGVHKAFGAHRVINGLDLSVPARSIFAFLGNNGEGKSTTIRLITGLLRPDAGSIAVLGMDVRRERRAILAEIGVIVDAACFYPNLTAAEFLRIGCAIKSLPKSEIGRVLDMVSLGAARDRLVGRFSLGMKQRLAIAHALLGSPRLLILDEPSNGLDPEGIRDIRELLAALPQQGDCTVFVSSHNLDEVEKIATHVGVLKGGALLFEGPLAQLQSRQAGALLVDVRDAARAGLVLAAAGYRAEAGAACNQLTVHGVELQAADKVNALLVTSGAGLYQSVFRTPSLEQWFLKEHHA
ncbi:MAG: ATP-binding cassette domain-containing protein [Pseudomonadota bacterium]